MNNSRKYICAWTKKNRSIIFRQKVLYFYYQQTRRRRGRRLLNWIDGLLVWGKKEGRTHCLHHLARFKSQLIYYCWKNQQIVSSRLFLPIYTGFLYVCMYGWARALRGEAKSSSNKRSTCSVTTWSSVISAGSPPFCSSFLRAYALSQQHIFLAVVAFFQNFWKQGL